LTAEERSISLNDKRKAVLTPKQIRSKFNISLGQVYNLLKDPNDPIPHFRIGSSYRINEEEFNEWIERHHHIKRD